MHYQMRVDDTCRTENNRVKECEEPLTGTLQDIQKTCRKNLTCRIVRNCKEERGMEVVVEWGH